MGKVLKSLPSTAVGAGRSLTASAIHSKNIIPFPEIDFLRDFFSFFEEKDFEHDGIYYRLENGTPNRYPHPTSWNHI